MPDNNQAPNQDGMVFDSTPVAAGPPSSSIAKPAQVGQPETAGQPQPQPQTQGQTQNMTFDAQPRSAATDALESAHTLAADNKTQPSFGENMAQGFGGAAAQGLMGAAKLINRVPGVEYVSDKIGDLLGIPKMSAKTSDVLNATSKDVDRRAAAADLTSGGKVGSGLEGLAEFMVGEEIANGTLKVISAGDRLMEVAKAAKLLEKYPATAEAIKSAYVLKTAAAAGRIARTSAVAAGQAELHGEDPTKAAEYGAAGGAAGEVLGASAAALGKKTPEALAEAAGMKKMAEDELAKSQLKQVASTGATKIENVAITAAKDAGATTTEDSLNTPYNFSNAAFDLKATAKPVFEQLDKESNGAFQTAKTRVDNALKIIRNGASSVETLDAAQKQLSEAQSEMEQVFANSKLNPDDLQTARDAWRKASTFEELHDRLDRAFSMRSAALNIKAKGLADIGESLGGNAPDKVTVKAALNPKAFGTQMNAAINSIGEKRLIDALGEDGYDSFVTLNQKFTKFLSQQKSDRALQAVMQAAAAKSPKGSPISTLAVGAGAGYLGHLAGASVPYVGIPVAMAHFLYTHPVMGTKIIDAASKIAGAATVQTARQMGATHVYDPSQKQVTEVPKDVYSNGPSFQMSSESSPDAVWSMYPKNGDLANAIIQHEGRGKEPTNPGNLKFANQPGATQGINGFAKFESDDAGRRALVNQLAKWRRENPNMTTEDFARRYSPDSDPLNPVGTEAAYVAALKR